MRALDVIRAEHRSLAAVIHGLRHLVREVREHGARPDFGLLEAMLRYIDAFPERLHHPKEDRYLFRRLRERDPAKCTHPRRARGRTRAGRAHDPRARRGTRALSRRGRGGVSRLCRIGRRVRGVPLGAHAQGRGGGDAGGRASPVARGLGRDRRGIRQPRRPAVRRRCRDRVRHAVPQDRRPRAAADRRRTGRARKVGSDSTFRKVGSEPPAWRKVESDPDFPSRGPVRPARRGRAA